MKRAGGYLLSAILASLFYIGCLFLFISSQASTAGELSFLAKLGVASFFWLMGGFGPALIIMALPWILAVRLYSKYRRSGPSFFVLIGALATFVIGCGTAAFSPKPLFVEDQTFLEAVVIAAKRQGIVFLLAGIIFGFSYWFLTERRPTSN